MVPPIGALAERVQSSGAGVVLTDAEWRDEAQMLDRLIAVLGDDGRAQLAAMATRARAVPHATIESMTRLTFALYADAIESAPRPAAGSVFEPGRMRAALRYVAWDPPAPVQSKATDVRHDWVARVAQAALARRHTRAGRVLARCAPAPLLAALRARLKP
jgi:hypothetical protein